MASTITKRTKMKGLLVTIIITFFFGCKTEKKEIAPPVLWTPYDETEALRANEDHEVDRMRYRLIESKVLDKNEVFNPLYEEVSQMTAGDYRALKPLILEQDIPTIQSHIVSGMLTYEKLVLFYLYRIYHYELNNKTHLNTVIALNPSVVDEARKLDKLNERTTAGQRHPIHGIPILLKDNIGASGMPTTAGAIALRDNNASDAFIVRQLKSKGALILGKVNLSEWAYFLCEGCPVGYSAIGGQTLNPYGRMVFETGGSSSGSGTSVAVNYAAAAIGTETSGSILSPSSKNSVVGLKPTVGLLSRSGIVPISSTLDTPGPMTKNVIDNAIVLSAMLGRDEADEKSVVSTETFLDWNTQTVSLLGKHFGAFRNLMEENDRYRKTIEKMREAGAKVTVFDAPEVPLQGFLSILNIDMRNDLPLYLISQTDKNKVPIRSVADAAQFNAQDSTVRIPYGQAIFTGMLDDTTTVEGLARIKRRLKNNGRHFFDKAMDKHGLDAILSINNYHAGYAAVAEYPALTIPMAYTDAGEPVGLTFIGKPFTENQLLQMAAAVEAMQKIRKLPSDFID